jgi:hypothetical protein
VWFIILCLWDAGHCYRTLYYLERCHLIIITDHSEMVDNLRIKKRDTNIELPCGVCLWGERAWGFVR